MDFIKEADIVVVGGGVVGCAILRELSRYNVKCVLLEKEPDIACGTTKATVLFCTPVLMHLPAA